MEEGGAVLSPSWVRTVTVPEMLCAAWIARKLWQFSEEQFGQQIFTRKWGLGVQDAGDHFEADSTGGSFVAIHVVAVSRNAVPLAALAAGIFMVDERRAVPL